MWGSHETSKWVLITYSTLLLKQITTVVNACGGDDACPRVSIFPEVGAPSGLSKGFRGWRIIADNLDPEGSDRLLIVGWTFGYQRAGRCDSRTRSVQAPGIIHPDDVVEPKNLPERKT
jgi:hypothetical protein